MSKTMRIMLLVGGTAVFVLAAGYFFQMPWAISTWPWPDGRLSYIFVSSIQAAIAAAMVWIAVSGDWGSLPAGALNLFVMLIGIAGFLFLYMRETSQPQLLLYFIILALFALGNLALFLTLNRRSADTSMRMPQPVKISFGVFVVLLVLVGGSLILKTPNIMPWPLKPETSVMIGWIFLGDAFYFLYALLRPYWSFARAQLWSFLAYDLVLIYPFLDHLRRVNPELLTSLILYLVVLIYSGSLAIYYLFIHKPTRVWAGQQNVFSVHLPGD